MGFALRTRLPLSLINIPNRGETLVSRHFFKLTTTALVVGLVSACAQAGVDPATLPVKNLKADVIVVGAGGTGLAAVAAARLAGAEVLVIEKLPMVGGSSAFAGGAIAAGDSNAQKRVGSQGTSTEEFVKIWLNDQKRSSAGGDPSYPDERLVRAMAREFTVTANWLEDKIGHKYAPPRPFGYGGPDFAHAPAESPVPASGRGSSPAGGRFVIQNLMKFLDAHQVPVMKGTPSDDLILNEKGDVVGVKAHNGKLRYEISGKAVVLATGGFPHNRAMLEKLVPDYAPYADLSVASIGDTGDGISMAIRAGAAPYTDAWVIGLYLNSEKKELNGVITSKDKYKDRVFINEKGLRFTNENLPYLTDAVVKEKAVWGIADSSDPEKVKAALKYNDPKYAVRGDTWEALAAAMGVPPDALARTMKDYNAACTTGDDKAFGKAKEFLKPFAKPPFFAVRVVPKTGGTIGGVKVNDKFQVVREDGSVIKGLYAGGEVINRPYYNRVYTSGTGLGIAYTSGRIAGTNAAAER